MLTAASLVLGLAVIAGGVLAVLWLRRGGALPPVALALGHAVLAAAGLGLLIAALAGTRRGEATGTQSFGAIAAVALALAGLVGLAMLALRLRRRPIPGAVVGIHASLAVAGFVVLAAYALLG